MCMTVPESEPEPAACCAKASPSKPTTAAPSTAAATKNFIRDLTPLSVLIEAPLFDGRAA
jgi:hypothetical protein